MSQDRWHTAVCSRKPGKPGVQTQTLILKIKSSSLAHPMPLISTLQTKGQEELYSVSARSEQRDCLEEKLPEL